LAGIAAAAMTGCCTTAIFRDHQDNLRGLIPVYFVLVGGCAFVGFMEPEPPQVGLLIILAAPLALWACVAGPLANKSGWMSYAIPAVLVAVPMIAGIVVVAARYAG
jgi:hypothetical protein